MRLALFLLVLAACTEDFDPYYRLTEPRVLALRSDPAAPASGETTTLSGLVYTPPGMAVDSYAWSWCPFPGPASDGYACLITEADLAAFGGGEAAGVPPFDLGTGETARLANSIDPALLARVCAGVAGQATLDCTGGFPVQVKLVVRAGSAEVTTVRGLRLRFAAAHEANANPTIDGMAAIVDGAEQPLDGLTLTRRVDTALRAALPESASETFTGRGDDGQPAPERERITFSWFVESGHLDRARSAYIDGVVALSDAEANSWRPDDAVDYPPATADLILVVRDSRDGVAWTRDRVALTEGP